MFRQCSAGGGLDKVIYTNGRPISASKGKRQGIRTDVASYGSLREMFRDLPLGTHSDYGDSDDLLDEESGQYFSGATGWNGDHDTGVVNFHRSNWCFGNARILSSSCSDACIYGGTTMVGAGFHWAHVAGNDVGAYPAADTAGCCASFSGSVLSSEYDQGKPMFLWIK